MGLPVQARARIAGIVLAAGRSSRMGRNKLLCELAGAPLCAHALRAALGAGLDPVHVVTGCEAEQVRAALQPYATSVRFAHNPDFEQGMASSLQVGLRAL